MIYIKLKNEGFIKPKKFYHQKIVFISFISILLINMFFSVKYKIKTKNKKIINKISGNNEKVLFEKCYIPPENNDIKIVHAIITRFIIKFWRRDNFTEKIYREDYLQNGIRVLKKYLLPSLENQICKKFIWILMLGDKANITNIEILLDYKSSFEYKVIYQKDINNYIKNISKGFDVLITTRIDYDDRIYYDAVNDVRKSINLEKPIIFYGYNSGLNYYEAENKYYVFGRNYKNNGVMSIFLSLILILNKVNGTYTIYDFGHHHVIRKTFMQSYKSYGINKLDYEPAIFDSGTKKFVWVRQNYSGQYLYTESIKNKLKLYNFSLNKFYGK